VLFLSLLLLHLLLLCLFCCFCFSGAVLVAPAATFVVVVPVLVDATDVVPVLVDATDLVVACA
jgi:hypothetical protein